MRRNELHDRQASGPQGLMCKRVREGMGQAGGPVAQLAEMGSPFSLSRYLRVTVWGSTSHWWCLLVIMVPQRST